MGCLTVFGLFQVQRKWRRNRGEKHPCCAFFFVIGGGGPGLKPDMETKGNAMENRLSLKMPQGVVLLSGPRGMAHKIQVALVQGENT